MDFIDNFRAAMAKDGIVTHETIIPDGKIHRFHVAGDSANSKNGWYILYSDEVPGGAYGCWKRDISKTWCLKQKSSMSTAEWATHQSRINEAKKQREEEERKARDAARDKAQRMFKTAYPAKDNHPYLKRKGISAQGIKCINFNDKEVLTIPLYNRNGIIQNLQFIDEDGNKYFLTDGGVKENYFPIKSKGKNITGKIGIAEGVATGIFISDTLECSVACAFNCGNLLAIARLMREKYPHAEIILFADNDQWPDENGVINNVGLNKAREAAQLINATVAVPEFSGFDTSHKPTDWLDLKLIAGIEETHRQLQLAINKANNDPQPLPEALKKVSSFDTEMLPESIKNYVFDIADRQRCPVDFVAVTAVCGLAAVLGRKILVRPKQHDDWTVTPNLWGAIIGRPSAMKSPAMKAALEPLYKIEAEAAKEYEFLKIQYDINQEFAELHRSHLKQEAKMQIKTKTKKHEEIKADLKEACIGELPPIRKRLIVNDSTIEKLGELLNENSNGLVLVRDELAGWLSNLTREEHQAERAFYLECYNGSGSFVYDRIGRGTIDIKNLTLSIIGGIQPSKISPIVRDSVRGVTDDGLVQRLQITVWPNDNKEWKWTDRAPDEKSRTAYFDAFNTLYSISPEKSLYLRFDTDAQKMFIAWMEEIQSVARAEDTHPVLESHLLKMPETVASLALLFELLENGIESKCITLKAIAMALDWADYLRSHAERLYSAATMQGLSGAHLILKRFNKLNDEFTARDVQRKGWTGLNEPRDVEEALSYLIDYKHLTSYEVPTSIAGGRPKTVYIKNKKYIQQGA